MHVILKKIFTMMTACWLFSAFGMISLATAEEPRVFLGGLVGSGTEVAALDFLIPVATNNYTSLFYADVQGKADTRTSWFTGLGIGYRGRQANRLLGGYFFVDRSYSTGHYAYYFLNPGIETISQTVDARVNGYFPVGNQKNSYLFGFSSIMDTCGNNVGCENVLFQGHQELLPIYRKFEEVGPGVDIEIGGHFGCNHNFSIYGGAYYFHFPNVEPLKGLEARLIIPLKPTIALTAEATYDTERHGAFLAGIRIQGGHLPRTPMLLEDRLYDPIPRNLATLNSGLGEPVGQGEAFDHYLLVRDNIFFFSAEGGSTFTGPDSGTYENPLASNQFTQTTVDGISAISPNADLFFNTGTYIINGAPVTAPNASLSLPGGQTLSGRTSDYRCSAVGDERPTLAGEIQLLSGNNTLDSIILSNVLTSTSTLPPTLLTALNIQNAANVVICNSEINAEINSSGSSTVLEAVGITASNSMVNIETSDISAMINVTSNSNSFVIGIGGGDLAPNFTGNNFTITNSEILASSTGESVGFNESVGVGSISGVFSDNIINMTNTQILSSTTTEGMGGNLSTGIGGNDADVMDNSFTLTNVQITSQSVVGNNFAASVGIGLNEDGAINVFSNNDIILNQSQVSSTAVNTQNDVSTFLFSVGIGANAVSEGTASFMSNTISFVNSAISSSATSQYYPSLFVAGIGLNSVSGVAYFGDNSVASQNSAIMASSANGTTGTMANPDFVSGIGVNVYNGFGSFGLTATAMPSPNSFTLNGGSITATSTITGTNANIHNVIGIGANAAPITGTIENSTFNITGLNLNVLARVDGNNSVSNQAVGLEADNNTVINFIASQGLVQAIITGSNTGSNLARAYFTTGTGVVNGGSSIQTVQSP